MKPSPQGLIVLAGSILLMLLLGSVHAFSVFLEPIEGTFGVSRASSSITYSLSLIAITVVVLNGHHIFRRLNPVWLAVAVCLVAGAGGLMAAFAGHILFVWIGYGLLFGAANGLGYACALQFSAQANPRMSGGAMGVVTAAYGLGAAVAPLPLFALLTAYGFEGGMIGLAVSLFAIAPVVAFLYARSGRTLAVEEEEGGSGTPATRGDLIRLWTAYGTAVFSGLMVIGHATGIARAAGLEPALLYVAPIVIALANVVGSLLGGYLVDALGPRRLLTTVALVSILSMIAMYLWPEPAVTLAALGGAGFAYGATIAAFPAAISKTYGSVAGIRVYGKVFTAWGTAGLLAPWSAGILFEMTGAYTLTLLLALLFGLGSVVAIFCMPRAN